MTQNNRIDQKAPFLAHRSIPVLMAILAVLIMLPALDEGLMLDDFGHRVKLIDPAQLPPNFHDTGFIRPDAGSLKAALRDMHAFIRNEEDLEKLTDYGLCPWWTSPDLRIANFRPLDSFSHWLDYKLYPDKPWLMHAHSILWFAGLVLLLTMLYRRLILPLAVAAIAAVLFIIDDSNYFPVMWVANRNLPHALFFSLLTILLHIHWRKNDSFWASLLVPVCLLLSLLSTEAGIATMAYLFVYALILDKGTFKERIATLIPAMIIIVSWRIVYNLLGYGAAGSGFVIDPVREPVAFFKALCIRGPLLLAGLTGMQPAETYSMVSQDAKIVHFSFAMGSLLVTIPALICLLRKNRVAVFWFVCMLLCIVPICATKPMNRNLLFASIAACALFGIFIHGVFTRQSWLPSSRVGKVYVWFVCILLLIVHVPGAIAGRIVSARMMPKAFDLFYSTIEPPSDTSLQDKTLIVVNPPNPYMYLALPVVSAWRDQPLPDRIRLLAPGFGPVTITRITDKSLVISSDQDNLFTVRTEKQYYQPHFAYAYEDFSSLFRSIESPFQPGQTIKLSDMSVEILKTDNHGIPAKIKITLDTPVDDPSLVWLQWNWSKRGTGSYTTFTFPAVGESVSLQGPF